MCRSCGRHRIGTLYGINVFASIRFGFVIKGTWLPSPLFNIVFMGAVRLGLHKSIAAPIVFANVASSL